MAHGKLMLREHVGRCLSCRSLWTHSVARFSAPLRAGPGVANGYRLPARKQGVFDQRYFDANGIADDAARGARYAALKRVVRWPAKTAVAATAVHSAVRVHEPALLLTFSAQHLATQAVQRRSTHRTEALQHNLAMKHSELCYTLPKPALPAQVDPGVRLYHALWDAYEHPAAPPSAGPRACPDGYEQVRACNPRVYPLPCSQELATASQEWHLHVL